MAWGFLAKLKQMATGLVADAQKYMKGDVFDALMATVVMVGWADGDFDGSEKVKALQIVQNHPMMAGRTADEVKKAFDKYDGVFTLDVGMGKDEAMKAIDKIASVEDEAKTFVIRAGIMIGAADGDFDDNEKRVVREICQRIGQRPANFEL